MYTKNAPVVALDIGNVCLTLAPDRGARRLGMKSIRDLTERFPDVVELAYHLETGQLQTAEFLEYAREVMHNVTEKDIEEAWHLFIGNEVTGMEELVREMVAAGLEVVFFSDISELHYEIVRSKISFASLVSNGVLSCRVGAAKPDTAMYETMEKQFCRGGVPAFYIDDRKPNIQAARKRGWNAYRFGTIQGARKQLHRTLTEIRPQWTDYANH